MLRRFPLRFLFALLSSLPLCARTAGPLPSQIVSIPFISEPISINGDLSEWSSAAAIEWRKDNGRGQRDNAVTVKLLWDTERLYIAFVVTDTDLRGNRVRDEQELWFDDAVEVFLDTRNDAQRSARMNESEFERMGGEFWGEKRVFSDENDYHVVVNIHGSRVILRGEGLSYRGTAVKADVSQAVQYTGTLNDGRDADAGFVVEMAIAWKSVRLKAHNGLRFGAQFGIEDVDSDDRFPSGWCDIRPHHQPDLWGRAELSGGPRSVAGWPALLGWLAAGLFVFSMAGMAWTLYSRKRSTVAAGGGVRSIRALEMAAAVEYYISRHYASTDASIGEAARGLCVSHRCLQMMLKQAGKPAFREMLAAYRFMKAEEMLQNTSKSVSEIAFAVGFNSPAVFSAAYRKHTGHSPSDLRSHNGA